MLGAAVGVGAGVEEHHRAALPGSVVTMAGRRIPRTRFTTSSEAASIAPVLPAETKPWTGLRRPSVPPPLWRSPA